MRLAATIAAAIFTILLILITFNEQSVMMLKLSAARTNGTLATQRQSADEAEQTGAPAAPRSNATSSEGLFRSQLNRDLLLVTPDRGCFIRADASAIIVNSVRLPIENDPANGHSVDCDTYRLDGLCDGGAVKQAFGKT